MRTDEQLVAMFRAGQDEAFRAIHDRYRARLFAYARQMLPARQDAEDALQDVFVRAYAGLRANDRELALRAWLYRVAHNRCIDELRRPVPPPTERIHLCNAVDDPVARADQRESLRRLIGDIRRLPEQQRSALLMRELGGMSYAEVAGALAISVPAVKSLLVRARIGLVQAIEARDAACSEIRTELMLAHDRRVRPGARARRHMRDCAGCRDFRRDMRGVSRQLAALGPALGPLGALANVLGFGTSGGAAAGGGSAAAGGAVGGTGAAASAGALTGMGHVATLLAATVVAAGGAVELQHSIATTPRPAHHAFARAASHSAAARRVSPVLAPEQGAASGADGAAAQPASTGTARKPPSSTAGSSVNSSTSTGGSPGTSSATTRVTSGIGVEDQLAPVGGPVSSSTPGSGDGSLTPQGGTPSTGTTPPAGNGTTTGTGGTLGGTPGSGCPAGVTVCQAGTPQSGSPGGSTSTGGGSTGGGSTGGSSGGGTSGGGSTGGTGNGGGSSGSAP